LNSDSSPQATNRIARKVTVSASAMTSIITRHFLLAGGLSALVSDGEWGHAIYLTKASADGSRISFVDPWPGQSRLCEANNAAGVRALPDRGHWQVTQGELSKVLVALIIRMDTWSYLDSAALAT
jgi:hypothetical protein